MSYMMMEDSGNLDWLHLNVVLLQKFFRRKTARDLLPVKPVETAIEAWWVVQAGYITEDDIKVETKTRVFIF